MLPIRSSRIASADPRLSRMVRRARRGEVERNRRHFSQYLLAGLIYFSGYGGILVPMRVLVVDDDAAVRNSLDRALRLNGYTVDLAVDGADALQQVEEEPPDAMVLDVLMPNTDGLEVCRRMRALGNRTPILMLTAQDSVSHRVSGLDAGADDYLPKPFSLDELLARLRALLRRSVAEGASEDGTIEFADLRMDFSTFEVFLADRRIELTRTEFSLLELFMRNPRQVLTRDIINERVWGYDFPTSSNSLEVYVGYLRRKLEAEGEPRLLQTVRGFGYVLRQPWVSAPELPSPPPARSPLRWRWCRSQPGWPRPGPCAMKWTATSRKPPPSW